MTSAVSATTGCMLFCGHSIIANLRNTCDDQQHVSASGMNGTHYTTSGFRTDRYESFESFDNLAEMCSSIENIRLDVHGNSTHDGGSVLTCYRSTVSHLYRATNVVVITHTPYMGPCWRVMPVRGARTMPNKSTRYLMLNICADIVVHCIFNITRNELVTTCQDSKQQPIVFGVAVHWL